ncbi:hypothetical protein [Spirulina major]|nr:hypothetical protein [Spirulina major]
MMRLSAKLWGGLVAGVLLVGLPGGVMGLDGSAIALPMLARIGE